MSELVRQLELARERIQVDWTPERASAVRKGMHRRRRRQAAARVAVGTVTAAAVALVIGIQVQRHAGSPLDPARGERGMVAQADRTVHLGEGISATPLDADTVVRPRTSTASLIVAELEHGRARFEVKHDPVRIFRVEVGPFTVEDLGTQFLVAGDGNGIDVTVDEGRVQVSWPNGEQIVSAGEQRHFSPGALVEVPEKVVHQPKPVRRPHIAQATKAPGWKSLAEDGDYDGAYQALHETQAEPVRDETQDLLLEVDVARLSHHPREALPPLRRILSAHRADPRAPLAAFTLGRVLLDDLGSPREAADAFSQAQRLDPSGPLAEDALAREVESLSRAGDTERAHAQAEVYVEKYPHGRRIRSVSRFGHLE